MRARHKNWALPYLKDHPDIVFFEAQETKSFLSEGPAYLEIGSGKGDFAISYSDKGGSFLALERESNVAAVLAKKIVESEKKNVRLLVGDFDVCYEGLKDYKFDLLFVNFPDPWPKKRHEKRRLTVASRLKLMVSLLKDGGEIRFKTDSDDLYEFTKEQIEAAGLHLILDQQDYSYDENNDAMSEYERNFRSEGKTIHRIVFTKK